MESINAVACPVCGKRYTPTRLQRKRLGTCSPPCSQRARRAKATFDRLRDEIKALNDSLHDPKAVLRRAKNEQD